MLRNDLRLTPDLDDTVSLAAPPRSAEIGSAADHQLSARAARATASARIRRLRQFNVLVIGQLPRLQRVVEELRLGQGVSSYALTCVSDRGRSATLLRDSSWDAFVFDETGFARLDVLPESDRLRILRSAVVVTELGAADIAALSAAECLPADRCTRFALDNALCRITRRKIASGRIKSRETLPDILWGIARRNLLGSCDLATAFRPLVETAARLLRLGRASVWKFHEHPKRLRCEAMFNAKTGEFSSGIEVPAALCPGYCSALENHRLLAIQDALADPRSRELVPICLRDAGIGALLDAPIYLNGEVVGLFCCAHAGGPRNWSEAEQHVAASFSDYSQLVLMANQHHESIGIVRAQRARMLRGQPLEIMGAMADMTNYRSSGLYSAIAVDIQHVLNDCAHNLTSEMHAHLLTALSSCEQGARLAAQVQAFSPSSAAVTASGEPISALEAAQTVTGMIRSLGVRAVRIAVEHAREAGAVRCDRAALTCALFSMAYQCLDQCPQGGQLSLSTQTLTANGRNRDCFEFAATCSALFPVEEFEAGLVLVANFASTAGATLCVEHVQGATRASLRLPLAGSRPEQRARDSGAIVIVADVEEPQELVDMLRFFKHNPVVLSTQDCLGYLRKEQARVKLVVLDAANSDSQVLDRLRLLRLATNRPIVVIGDPEDCAGVANDEVRLRVLPGASLASIAAHIDQALQCTMRA